WQVEIWTNVYRYLIVSFQRNIQAVMASKDLETGLVRPEGPFVRLPFIRKNPANPSAPYMV
ncbi:hypothetical protein E4U49_007395, partial [Claviceps purpurea]